MRHKSIKYEQTKLLKPVTVKSADPSLDGVSELASTLLLSILSILSIPTGFYLVFASGSIYPTNSIYNIYSTGSI